MAKYKPALKNRIEGALRSTDLAKYKESMQALVIKDIQKALDDIHNINAANI